MGQSKRRQKATPPPLRSDLRPKEVPLEVLHAHLDRAREALGDEGYADLRMAVDTLAFVNEEVERKDTSVLRLRHLLFGPKTESFAATCREAMKAENPPATGAPNLPKAWMLSRNAIPLLTRIDPPRSCSPEVTHPFSAREN